MRDAAGKADGWLKWFDIWHERLRVLDLTRIENEKRDDENGKNIP